MDVISKCHIYFQAQLDAYYNEIVAFSIFGIILGTLFLVWWKVRENRLAKEYPVDRTKWPKGYWDKRDDTP